MHNFLKAKLHIETSDSSQEKISELLAKHQVKESTISDFLGVLDDCNFGRYAPSNQLESKNIYEKASKVINQINIELR